MPGSPRGIQDEGAVVRRRVLGLEVLGGPVHEVFVGVPAVAIFAQRDEVAKPPGFPAHLLDLLDTFGA